jgi:hypothetical protein
MRKIRKVMNIRRNYTDIGIISKIISEFLSKEDLMLYYLAANTFNPKVHIMPTQYNISVDSQKRDKDVHLYMGLPDLKILDLSNCDFLTKRFSQDIRINVTSLNVSSCCQIDDISLKYITASFKHLQILSIYI